MPRASCIIVGAGVLGLCTAVALQELGSSVHVIEARAPGAGASGRSGALVRSSLATVEEARLAQASIGLFERLSARCPGAYSPVGCLTLFASGSDRRIQQALDVAQHAGTDLALVDPAKLGRICANIRVGDIGAALWQARAGCCDAGMVLGALAEMLTSRGGKLSYPCVATALKITGDRIIGVTTDQGDMRADHVVLAMGPWCGELLRPFDVPAMRTHLSRVAIFQPFENSPAATPPTIIDHIIGAWYRPYHGGRILVGLEEGGVRDIDPNGIPMGVPEPILQLYRSMLTSRFAVSEHAAPAGAWAGAYMVTGDGYHVVGKVPNSEGLYVASGDNGAAFKVAPALGMAVADMICGREGARFDISCLSPGRRSSSSACEAERVFS